MKKLFPFAASFALAFGALGGAPAYAQSVDIGARAQAYEDCLDFVSLGYGNYEVCVEQVYQDYLLFSLANPSPGGGGRSDRDPYDLICNSGGTRLSERPRCNFQ